MTDHSSMDWWTVIEEEYIGDNLEVSQVRTLLTTIFWNHVQTRAAISMFEHRHLQEHQERRCSILRVYALLLPSVACKTAQTY